MKKPLVSIGILNLNGKNYLKKTIPKIISQKYENKEIIVVDNGSIDGSISYLKKFKDIRIIINKKNEGYSKGKNKIVKFSKGKYIFLLDNDILLTDKDTINKLLIFYESINNVGFVSIPTVDKDSTKTRVYGLSYTKPVKFIEIKKILKKEPYEIGSTTGQNLFFNKEIWLKIGGIDEIYPFNIDDYDLGARAYNLGYLNWIFTKSYALHLGISRAKIDNWCWKNQFYLAGFSRMIIKNYSLNNLIIWLPLSMGWVTIKNLKQLFKTGNIKVLNSYFKSWYYLIRDLPDTLRLRQRIQNKRKNIKDIYLNIKFPDFK